MRLRLTLLYVGLFLASAACLLAITYFLVDQQLPQVTTTSSGAVVINGGVTQLTGGASVSGSCDASLGPCQPLLQAVAVRVSRDTLNQLLIESGIALGIMAVASVGLGWLMAGRVLSPGSRSRCCSRCPRRTRHAPFGIIMSVPMRDGRKPSEPREPREAADGAWPAGLGTVLREWGRIGVTGFGGPPAHIALLRRLCVDTRGWLDAAEFEDAIAACNLLPGPASTQLAIFCAWRVRGRLGAVAGGLAFIVPGLIIILVLSALFLAGAPPLWVRGAGAGAGAAVAAVAVQAGWGLLTPSWKRASAREPVRISRLRWALYLLAGGAASATIGPWLVLVLLGCGATELALRSDRRPRRPTVAPGIAPLFPAVLSGGLLASVAWMAFKVGALSFGGGFVIIPLMRADAVGRGWMTNDQFLNAVALGQITPGPVVQTVSAVGYAAAGLPGGLLAAVVAFSPSFAFVLGGGRYFSALRTNRAAQAFLDGAGPAAIGAIFGAAILLARVLSVGWQFAVLAGAAVLLLALRRGVVLTLLGAGAVGVIIALAGGPLPG